MGKNLAKLAMTVSLGMIPLAESSIVYGENKNSIPTKISNKSINYNGLSLEQAYQEALKKSEKSRESGLNLIVLCDDGNGTGLEIGNIKGAAQTLKRNLQGKTIIKEFNSDTAFFNYLIEGIDLNEGQKFKNIFWYGHGNSKSLWMDLTFKDESCYLDKSDFENLSPKQLISIQNRFTDDAQFKLYSCHSAADNIEGENIGTSFSKFMNMDGIGANSWTFIRGIPKDKRIDTFMYPATREDYRVEINPDFPDKEYTGKSAWIPFKK